MVSWCLSSVLLLAITVQSEISSCRDSRNRKVVARARECHWRVSRFCPGSCRSSRRNVWTSHNAATRNLVGGHPRKPDMSTATIHRASARVRTTPCTTQWSPQLRGHRPIGQFRTTALQLSASASWRPTANARAVDGNQPQDIGARAMDLLHHALASSIGWPSNN